MFINYLTTEPVKGFPDPKNMTLAQRDARARAYLAKPYPPLSEQEKAILFWNSQIDKHAPF